MGRNRGLSLLLGVLIVVAISPMVFNILVGYCASPSLYLSACDVDGNERSVFGVDEEDYAKGAGFSVNRQVTIYIIPDGQSVTPENAVAGPVNQTIAGFELPITLVWLAPTALGEYDVWVDINQNGRYDRTIDRHHFLCSSYYGFHVIHEYLFGALGSFTAMAASLIFFYKTRKSKRPK